jgi:hypothetical protein
MEFALAEVIDSVKNIQRSNVLPVGIVRILFIGINGSWCRLLRFSIPGFPPVIAAENLKHPSDTVFPHERNLLGKRRIPAECDSNRQVEIG